MADITATQAPPSLSAPSEKEKKYDRQLRLWAARGQAAVESANVLLLNNGSGTVGAETLKNLVLPGIGRFTIVDAAVVSEADLGVNFFLDEAALGKSRAQSCTELLLELNPEVQGEWYPHNSEKLDLTHFLETRDPFTIVLYTLPLQSDHLSVLESYSQKHKTPLIAIHSVGFYSYFKTRLPGVYPIVDTHPDPTAITDLRLVQPWEELAAFAAEMTCDIDNLDGHEHGHIPFVVILLHYLEVWKATHSGTPPITYSEKVAFRGEENFEEAAAAVLKTISPPALPAAVKQIFECKHAGENELYSSFWVIAAAVREFYEKHQSLPVPGGLPDMKAQSSAYVKLQNIYKAKSRRDAAEVLDLVRQKPGGEKVDPSDVDLFCKNAAFIKLIVPAEGDLDQLQVVAERELANDDLAREGIMPPSLLPVYLALYATSHNPMASPEEILSSIQRLVPSITKSERFSQAAAEVSRAGAACSKSEQGLSGLELMPGRDTEWDEERRGRDPIPIEADDVNALSLSVDRQSSYLGASSIKAALMCLLKVCPGLRHSLITPLQSVEVTQSFPTVRFRGTAPPKDTQRIPWSWKGQTLIDAYFKRIHVFVPMLDEAAFRADYLEGQRFDAPWLALLNMVFAMGSIVAMKSDDYNHINYYNRAMEHLPIDAFGNSHIETVQALAMIGGYYLHYINRPNMANAVLGAAIRMASALGLHRESLAKGVSDMAVAETRRRTWWSLFCLDTWATTTMGRPSFGRWGPAINIKPPEFGVNQGRDSAQHAGILPLIENIKFCKIATQIQDLLAISPLLRAEDRCNLDGQLLTWYGNLPWLLRTTDPCAEPLYIARCIMKWRYQNLRMLLHRPVLLSLASSGPLPQVAEPDVAAIETCRDLARQTVADISREWTRNQMSGWNAVWFLYQAAMIPLVGIFWQWNSPRVPEWRQQIETILDLLEAMEEWSLAARRSREVVWRMYEASRQRSMRTKSHLAGVAGDQALLLAETGLHMSPIGLEPEGMGMMGILDQQGLWDLDGMYWGPSPDPAVDFSSYGVNDSMMNLDYGIMSSQVAAMDGSFYAP
ncbi:NEDD8-activating enzyme E1 regulatory subunit [Colletotrichum spinosum]|uniref:NEDD8-activating enzyme E1 regulatory subunit n=1 Tax=Colletotrichum spinosum TaxID=1347390 RepID=A0A4V3HQY1_9PEZI|nr:NEDD8-activating enzyme E1 regulatory subunit [Colletotrichum spinosum]